MWDEDAALLLVDGDAVTYTVQVLMAAPVAAAADTRSHLLSVGSAVYVSLSVHGRVAGWRDRQIGRCGADTYRLVLIGDLLMMKQR